eukprot:6884963-Pyramimonas_sp.AAC.1
MKICSRGAAVTPRRALAKATTPSSTRRPHAAVDGSALDTRSASTGRRQRQTTRACGAPGVPGSS